MFVSSPNSPEKCLSNCRGLKNKRRSDQIFNELSVRHLINATFSAPFSCVLKTGHPQCHHVSKYHVSVKISGPPPLILISKSNWILWFYGNSNLTNAVDFLPIEVNSLPLAALSISSEIKPSPVSSSANEVEREWIRCYDPVILNK